MRAMFGVGLKDRKIVKDFMLMLGLSEAMDQFVRANSVHVNGCVEEGG